MAQDTYRRDSIQRQVAAMRDERSSFIDHYKLLSEFVKPRRGRFETTDRNRGERRHQSIINNRATKAHSIAVAGMFNGTMSPSRPWVILETDDPDLMEFGPVKGWFQFHQEMMQRILNSTNLYGVVPQMIGEELLFGTGCMFHDDDPTDMARFFAPTVGSYALAQNARLEVDTIAREFEMTVAQIVEKFSPSRDAIGENISLAVRTQYDRGNYHSWYPVVHFVGPNPDFRPGRLSPRYRPYKSCYYEPGNVDKDAFLREGGYYEFPIYAPRWETTYEDIYGTSCPGMVALGDIRQLQLQEKRKAQGIDKMVAPPLHGPPALKNAVINNLPGLSTIYDMGGTDKGLRPVYEVKLPIGELTLDIQAVENRINEAFFVDLFKAISMMRGIQPKNEMELIQRHQERLVELGPVMERQYADLLDPLVSRTFNQMVRAGLVLPPPREIADRPLKPRYVSTLALAQQATTTGNIEQLYLFVSTIAALYPEARHKFDALQAVDEYGRRIGAPPRLIVPDEEVERALAAERAQQQAQMMASMGQAAANIARDTGGQDLEKDSVARRMADAMSGRRPS